MGMAKGWSYVDYRFRLKSLRDVTIGNKTLEQSQTKGKKTGIGRGNNQAIHTQTRLSGHQPKNYQRLCF